jgi:hypothetical protein
VTVGKRATTIVPPWTWTRHFNAEKTPTTGYITDGNGDTVVDSVEQGIASKLCAWSRSLAEATGKPVRLHEDVYLPPHDTEEERAIAGVITAARTIQEFLWGEQNARWDLEEWRRMFRKRVAKLEEVDPRNPHAAVEVKKRLLQAAALAVAMIGRIDREGMPPSSCDTPSNLPGYDEPLFVPCDEPKPGSGFRGPD